MRLISSKQMRQRAVPHRYPSNPGYESRIHSFQFSDDGQLVAGYWEAPPGRFQADIDEQTEVNFVIEGEIELLQEGKSFVARAGDCFVAEPGDKLEWIVKKAIRTIYFIYPTNAELSRFFKELEAGGTWNT